MSRRWLVVLLLLVAACGGSKADTPSASVTTPPTDRTTTTRTPEQEVEAAYLKSWDVYAKAMFDLDDSLLPLAFAKDALSLRRSEVGSLKAQGKAARMRVDHRIAQVWLRNDAGYVTDNYVNHSVLVDPASGKAIEPDPGSNESRTYTLERIDGAWRVTFVFDNSRS